ncbi:MAG TPA: DUF4293 domain-containing protein [Bacteroidales bacterium]
MIQRIQSLYLSLIFLLSILFLNGSFLSFADESGSSIKVTFNGIFRDSGLQVTEQIEKTLPLTIFILLIPILSFIAIFLFKNRKIQLQLSMSVILIIAGFIGTSFYYGWFVITNYRAHLVPEIKMILMPVILICAILAYRGIKKDDNLVKSYDRLR